MRAIPAVLRAAAEQGAAYQAALDPAVRKRHGVWFTPPDLALGIAAEALRLLLAGRAAGGAGRPAGGASGSLRVLDPACGAGMFLAAVREASGVVAAELGLGAPPGLELVGCDIDGGALEVAHLAVPGARLVTADALLGPELEAERGTFDLVITNPPYVRADGGPDVSAYRERAVASGRFESLAAKWDLATAFVERGLQLCRTGGLAVYLLQDAYRRAAYARAQHAWLARRHAIRRLELYEGLRAFDAGVGSLALFVEQGTGRGRPAAVVRQDGERRRERRVAADSPPEAVFGWQLAREAGPDTARLAEVAFISYGLRANSDERRYPGAFVTADLLRDAPDPAHSRAYTEGKDLGGFRVLRTRWLEWGTDRAPAHFARRSFPEFLDAGPKILALCISGRDVRVALDPAGHAFNHTAVGILPWPALAGVDNAQVARAARGVNRHGAPALDLAYLLAVLNSRQTREALWGIRRSDKHVYPDDWREVRVPVCGADLQAAIGAEIAAACGLPYPSPEFEAAARRVQSLVDEAYRSKAGR